MDWAYAINNRLEVAFIYDGLPRVVQPATVGHSLRGNPSVRACQVGGGSATSAIPNWKMFTLAKVGMPTLTGKSFTTFASPGYTRGDSGFVSIQAEH